MNKIKVTGKNTSQKMLAKKVAEFALKKLLPRHRTIEIVIKFRNLEGVLGLCDYTDTNINPRQFEILLEKNLSDELIIETIMHEIIHVKQMVRNEMQDRVKSGYKKLWKGKDHTNLPYDKQGWEVEAYKMELELVREFLEKNQDELKRLAQKRAS